LIWSCEEKIFLFKYLIISVNCCFLKKSKA
jgi:hypothetical protein